MKRLQDEADVVERSDETLKRRVSDISGLQLVSDFITEEEEKILMDHIDARTWSKAISRRTQHYGYIYDYSSKNTSPKATDPIPAWCDFMVDRLMERGLLTQKPNQLIVNEYLPGQGIACHVDHIHHFADGIVSISLNAEVIMEFNCDVMLKKKMLPRRSALVLHGEARYKWRHGINRHAGVPKGQRRVSLTFRMKK